MSLVEATDVRVQVQGQKLIVTIENVKEAHHQHMFPANMWPYRYKDGLIPWQ